GDKLGFLEATVDFALKRPELQVGFMQYLEKVCKNPENNK
ncbi:MAG: UTP--glucose-1-phosphate uridylyltransferase, partial [Peptostreptococcaceae bacterium]